MLRVTANEHEQIVRRLHAEGKRAVVLTSFDTIEEGAVSEVDDQGFRIGPLGHWVWWPQVRRAGEMARGGSC